MRELPHQVSPAGSIPSPEFPFVGRIGAGPFQFVYVLKLSDGKWYVGSTADPSRRIEQHCRREGAVATQLSAPAALVALFRFRDCYYAGQPARLRIEMHIATTLAQEVGVGLVQGARHGSGQRLRPTKRGKRVLEKNERFIRSEMGRRMLAAVEILSPEVYAPVIGRMLREAGLPPVMIHGRLGNDEFLPHAWPHAATPVKVVRAARGSTFPSSLRASSVTGRAPRGQRAERATTTGQ